MIGAAIGGSGGDTSSQPQQAADKPQPKEQKKEPKPEDIKPKMAQVGQQIRAGELLWTVDEATYATQLEDVYNIDPPKQGNFVIVDFTLVNNRNEAVTLTDTHVTLRDFEKREYTPDMDTFSYIPSERHILLTQINPGVSQEGTVSFSVAPDAEGFVLTLDALELMGDDTAQVDLGQLAQEAPAASTATATARASAAAQ